LKKKKVKEKKAWWIEQCELVPRKWNPWNCKHLWWNETSRLALSGRQFRRISQNKGVEKNEFSLHLQLRCNSRSRC